METRSPWGADNGGGNTGTASKSRDEEASGLYDTYEEQPGWMATKKGAAARIWLDDRVYPMWTGFITKGWREVHYNMKIHQIVTTTRKIRRAMEEGR
jgi:hypothetical protein